MVNSTNLHVVLRTLGIVGLFIVVISQSSRFESQLINIKYTPYLIIASLGLISVGLYFKIKFAEKESSTLAYLSTIVTFVVALIIGALYLYFFFLNA